MARIGKGSLIYSEEDAAVIFSKRKVMDLTEYNTVYLLQLDLILTTFNYI